MCTDNGIVKGQRKDDCMDGLIDKKKGCDCKEKKHTPLSELVRRIEKAGGQGKTAGKK